MLEDKELYTDLQKYIDEEHPKDPPDDGLGNKSEFARDRNIFHQQVNQWIESEYKVLPNGDVVKIISKKRKRKLK